MTGNSRLRSGPLPGRDQMRTIAPSVHIPAVAADVPDRPRLVELFEDSVADSPLVLVMASEGMGKTTAAAQWGRQHAKHSVVWVDAGEAGTNGWDFFTHLVEELLAAGELTAAENGLGGVQAPRPLTRMGISLARQLQHDGAAPVVVVDRADQLSQESLALVGVLARREPLRVILLATRLDQDFVIDVQAEFQAPIIGDSALQLSEAEVHTALELAGLRVDGLWSLPDITSPMMLRSLVLHARQQGENTISEHAVQGLRHQLTLRSVRRRLAEDATHDETGAVLRLVLAPVVDESLTASLLGTGVQAARGVLKSLHEFGVGEFSPDGSFRFDAVLDAGLRELALERTGPEDLRRSYAAIAEWYAQHGKPRDALHFAEQAFDWRLIAEVTLRHFDELYHGSLPELQRALDRVPLDQIRAAPYLGWFRLQLLADRSETTLATLTAVGDQLLSVLDPEAEGLTGLLNDVFIYGYYRVRGDFGKADELISDLLPRLEGLAAGTFPGGIPHEQHFIVDAVQNWAGRAIRQHAASTKLFLGHHDLALGLIEPVVQSLSDESGHFHWRSLYSAGLKALIHASSGNIAAAEAVLRWLESSELPPAWDESYFGAPACIASAYVSMSQQLPQTAAADLDRVKQFQGSTELWAFILDIRARIALYFKESGMATYIDVELASRASRPPTSNYMQVQLLARAAAVAMEAGVLPAAETFLDRARDLDYPMRPGVSIERVAAVLAIFNEDWFAARELARDILARGSTTLREELSMRICLVQAELGLVTERHPVADRQTVGRAFLAAMALANEAGSPYDVLLIPANKLRPLLQEYAPHRRDLLAEMQRKSAHRSDFGERQDDPLTAAEGRVLAELSHTSVRSTIADRLQLSENTVKTHLSTIYRKLAVRSRAEALERAYGSGWISRQDEGRH